LQTDDYSETKDCRCLSKTSGLIAVCGRKRLFEIFSTIVAERIQAFSSPIVEEENDRFPPHPLAQLFVPKIVTPLKAKYGKHTLFLGSCFLAHKNAHHEGETKRKRLAIPMFLGKVE
jgi:hypothetical protein